MAEKLLLPCSIVSRRFKQLQRFLVACVALANVLLLSWAINLRQRVCDVRDWEFASSLFDSTRLVSRGPLLLHSANGSCTIAWESFSPTSLHFIQPSQPFASHSSASSLWFPHYIGLVQAPFGCAWNVSAASSALASRSIARAVTCACRCTACSCLPAPTTSCSAFVPLPPNASASHSASCSSSFPLVAPEFLLLATLSAGKRFLSSTWLLLQACSGLRSCCCIWAILHSGQTLMVTGTSDSSGR